MVLNPSLRNVDSTEYVTGTLTQLEVLDSVFKNHETQSVAQLQSFADSTSWPLWLCLEAIFLSIEKLNVSLATSPKAQPCGHQEHPEPSCLGSTALAGSCTGGQCLPVQIAMFCGKWEAEIVVISPGLRGLWGAALVSWVTSFREGQPWGRLRRLN